MKINITELIANPNNPRKISKDSKASLGTEEYSALNALSYLY